VSPAARFIACVLLASAVLAAPLRTRAQEPASHPPGVASAQPPIEASTLPDPPPSPTEAGGMMGGAMGGERAMGMGGEKGMGMRQMMDAMRRPKSTELFPTLLELSVDDERTRADLERRATARMSEAETVLSEELRAFSAAAREDDLVAMERAARGAREGISQIESAVAVRRALSEGGGARRSALRWFQSELGLLQSHSAPPARRILGMDPFEFFICSLLALAIIIGLWLYALRMRRATQLLERLVAGDSTEPPKEGGMPAAQNSPTPVDPRPSAAGDSPGQRGLLPVDRKTLCRLRATRIFQETPEVKTFRLVACDRGPIPFSYLPGQFLTLTLPVGEKPIRRSYTISSAPTQGYYCEITVKREAQGEGSRFLHDRFSEGQTLEVRGPSGRFTFTGDEAENIVLIGGGVGITPTMSVARALTDMGWSGRIDFVVVCRDPNHFIFADELERIARAHSNLQLHIAMSRLEEDAPGVHRGRLTAECLTGWIPDIATRRVHLCGAPPMMQATKSLLSDLGVPEAQIHTESFGSQQKPERSRPAPEASPTADAFEAVFQHSGKSTRLLDAETLLEAAERIGVDLDYSCRVGSCGECAVRLLSGAVKMEIEDALEPEDKAAGIILACQACATSNVTVEA